ncbi:MAG TPA: MmcQ/YjbR family DNA-binding protein [Gammaproteobacteria bacterium]|nr:MmcQ/YjbR family DNA-binding protein [Gammaproteobacteria bacterium]
MGGSSLNRVGKEQLEKYLSSQKGAESGYPFGPEALVFKVMGKMFALVSQRDRPARVTLKCRPADAEVLVNQYDSVVPGYYMNKRHWITISLDGDLPEPVLTSLVDTSYALVVDNLTKAQQRRLAQLTPP